jgi:hypothetical protein
MSEKLSEIGERLAVLETEMANHLKHHERWNKCLLLVIVPGVTFLAVERLIAILF